MNKMTLRDHFAGLAMQSLVVPQDNSYDFTNNAEMAYDQADAMIAERNKNMKERHEELCEGEPV